MPKNQNTPHPNLKQKSHLAEHPKCKFFFERIFLQLRLDCRLRLFNVIIIFRAEPGVGRSVIQDDLASLHLGLEDKLGLGARSKRKDASNGASFVLELASVDKNLRIFIVRGLTRTTHQTALEALG